jgi:hypothetical protein
MLQRYVVLLLFALQVAFSPWLAGASRLAIQNTADEDLLLVCTGAQYRWISLSASASSGQFSFVDIPVESPDTPDNHLPICLMGWLQLDQTLITDALDILAVSQYDDVTTLQYVAREQRIVVSYSPRAPPSFLIV